LAVILRQIEDLLHYVFDEFAVVNVIVCV